MDPETKVEEDVELKSGLTELGNSSLLPANIKLEDVQTAEQDVQDSADNDIIQQDDPPPASFKGQLSMSRFVYSKPGPKRTPSGTGTGPGPRRSPRISAPPGSNNNNNNNSAPPTSLSVTIRSSSSSSSISAATTKRKAAGAADRLLSPSPTKRSKSRAPNPFSSPSSSSSSSSFPAGYAPPSRYAHLPELRDVLAPNLICLFVGLNPGLTTAATGHAYAHPSNLFWKLLHSSGCTPSPPPPLPRAAGHVGSSSSSSSSRRPLRPCEDGTLPRRFGLGNTNIVARPTRNGGELSRREMVAGVAALEAKVRRWRPEAVTFVGKSIWESVWMARKGRALTKEQFGYGWQPDTERFGGGGGGGGGGSGGIAAAWGRRRTEEADRKVDGEGEWEGIGEERVEEGGGGGNAGEEEAEETATPWKGARIFVATSTSGLAASMSREEKEVIWRQLGAWVEMRREERGEKADME